MKTTAKHTPKMAEALLALIECAEILAAQCRVSGDEGHARMYQARAEAGRALKAAATGMADAIADTMHCIDVLGYELPFDVQNALRAALAKATGQ
jgi:hypothetical protein